MSRELHNKAIIKRTGVSWATIARYAAPEYVTALLLYSMPFWLDSYFIGHLKSTDAYATLNATNSLLHLLLKAAEGVSVGTVILAGRFNGQQHYQDVGYVLKDSFWITSVIGFLFACALSLGAPWIYWWYGVPSEMIELGIPFLQLRALGVLFSFVFAAFAGFLRGIKDTRMVMNLFIIGSVVFVICDYLFIFGVGPIPALGLQGSALASVIQYASMGIAAYLILCANKKYRPYRIHLFSHLNKEYIKQILMLSWPVIIDKTVMALSYVWLCKAVCPLGTCIIATFCSIKDIERFALLPAIALGQVVTLLVSNDWGVKNWAGITHNVRKIAYATVIIVAGITTVLMFNSRSIAHIFDRTGDFMDLVPQVFPVVGVLILFDVLQLVLAGALRGSGNVKIVMITRLAVTLFFFIPISYFLAQSAWISPVTRLMLVYSSFYCGNALMLGFYLYWFASGRWRNVVV